MNYIIGNNYKGTIRISSSEILEQTIIHHLPNNVRFKYLEVYTIPIGNQQYQVQQIVQILTGDTRILLANTFAHNQARLYVNIYLNNKLYYLLPSISFTTKQYNLIYKSYIPQAISAMGYKRTWTLTLQYGTHDYGGLQLNNCEVEALIKKINAIQSLVAKPDSSKIKLLIIN